MKHKVLALLVVFLLVFTGVASAWTPAGTWEVTGTVHATLLKSATVLSGVPMTGTINIDVLANHGLMARVDYSYTFQIQGNPLTLSGYYLVDRLYIDTETPTATSTCYMPFDFDYPSGGNWFQISSLTLNSENGGTLQLSFQPLPLGGTFPGTDILMVYTVTEMLSVKRVKVGDDGSSEPVDNGDGKTWKESSAPWYFAGPGKMYPTGPSNDSPEKVKVSGSVTFDRGYGEGDVTLNLTCETQSKGTKTYTATGKYRSSYDSLYSKMTTPTPTNPFNTSSVMTIEESGEVGCRTDFKFVGADLGYCSIRLPTNHMESSAGSEVWVILCPDLKLTHEPAVYDDDDDTGSDGPSDGDDNPGNGSNPGSGSGDNGSGSSGDSGGGGCQTGYGAIALLLASAVLCLKKIRSR